MLFTDSSFRVNKLCFSSFPYHALPFHNPVREELPTIRELILNCVLCLGSRATPMRSWNVCRPDWVVLAPHCGVLLPIFKVFFHSHKVLGRQSNFLVFDEIENAPKNHQNVVANQSTVLLNLAFFESSRQAFRQRFALWFAGYADFPQGLEAMPCRDEPLILGDFQ